MHSLVVFLKQPQEQFLKTFLKESLEEFRKESLQLYLNSGTLYEDNSWVIFEGIRAKFSNRIPRAIRESMNLF